MRVLLFEGGTGASLEIREGLSAKGISVTPVEDVTVCLANLEADRDATLIVDLDHNGSGIGSVQEILRVYPDTIVIVLASLERLALVDEALKQGAWDYVVKQPDFSHVEEVPQAITRNNQWKRLRSENGRYQEENRWLSAAFRESPDGIFVADQEGKIVLANPALCSQLAYVGKELIGHPIDKLVSSVETKESSWIEVPHPFPHKQWQGKIVLKKKDGSELAVRTKMTQILDEAGETTALVGICLEHEKEEPRPSPPARQEHGARDEMLANIAEDLKMPLAAMIGYLEMALSIGPDRAEPHQLLAIRRIEALTKRLCDVVANHSEALDIEAGKFEVRKAPLQLHRVLERAVEDRKSEADAKKVELVLEAAKHLPPISMDAVQIERAVGVLLSNAITLSPLGGKVTVSLRVDGNKIAVALKGSGASISQEEIPFLFDRRKRLHRGGEGINTVGLYVAQHIATAHGGNIEVQTNPEEGTTLTISLPV